MKKQKNPVQLYGCCLLVLCLLCAGCSRKTVEQPVEIQMMHGWGSNNPVHAAMRDIFAGFQESRPDIHITSISLPNNSNVIYDLANDRLAAGLMADIVMTGGIASFVRQAAKMGKALDLLPSIEADLDFKKSVNPLVFSLWTEPDGGLYTITDVLEIQGYWYNEEIWRNAGIERVPSTWREFWDMCDKVQGLSKKAHNDVTVFALEEEQIVEGLLLARLAASEEGRALASETPVSFEHPAIRAALADIRKAYGYSRPAENLKSTRQAFRDGKIAVYCNGVWESPEIMAGASAASIRYANYPTDDGHSLSYMSPAAGYVLHKSGDPAREQASVDFLKYLLSEPRQMKIALETGHPPSNPNVDIELLKDEQPLLYMGLKGARSAEFHITSIDMVWEGWVIDALRANIIAFYQGKISLDTLISRLNEA